MKRAELMNTFFIRIIWLATALFLTACGAWFGSRTQPNVSHDMRAEQRFNETTSFPYTASDERRNGIVANANKVSAGMTGDQVYNALGIPDEAEVIAFPLESAQGWTWDYNLYKMYRNAPDERDSYVRIVFDRDGKVSKIHKENINLLSQP